MLMTEEQMAAKLRELARDRNEYDIGPSMEALADEIDSLHGAQGGVLPLYVDDGTIIDCVSISGGADSTNGVPNKLTIAIKRPDGSEQHVQYIRKQATDDAIDYAEQARREEREKIARYFDDLYPEWAATIRAMTQETQDE